MNGPVEPMLKMHPALAAVQLSRVQGLERSVQADVLAIEEPLEIRLVWTDAGRQKMQSISVTMRTPGDDFELAAGFLLTEGIVADRDQIVRMRPCGKENVVRVELHPDVVVDLDRIQRHFYTSSSCGVCGKTSLEAVKSLCRSVAASGFPLIESSTISTLPRILRASQEVFDQTGGLHAAALFDPDGTLLELREDVGRHNALDKLIGASFLAGRTPLTNVVLLLSGRISFELVQKAAVAGIPIVAAVGAPSSLAVDLAKDRGITLIGFVRSDRFNIYTGDDRIV